MRNSILNQKWKFYLRSRSSTFKRTLDFVFYYFLKFDKAWVFNILIPLSFSLLSIYAYVNYSQIFSVLPPQILAFVSFTSFFVPTFFSISLLEWRNSHLLKRMKFVDVKKNDIIISFIFVSFFFSFISIAIQYFFIWIEALSFSKIYNVFTNLVNIKYYIWFWYIFANLLIITLVFLLEIVLSSFSYSQAINIIIIIVLFIVLVLFSDILIWSFSSSRSKFLTYAGYLILTKYCVYLILLTSSYTFMDKNGIQQIILDNTYTRTYIFTYSIYLCIGVSIISIAALNFLSIKMFKWKGNE
ncbi:hypothetical protein [Spiroplasma endosymbiont of Aspidapion aeneum]|uniref:hypothetical protein n=1 Tax=Spiroplasma endosymbiont of Aspidapion aeneum TaxID=3066276 RepID=UPI00313AC52C